MRVYQPMNGLHAPVIVDPAAPNLQGLRVGVRCARGDLGPAEAAGLCRKVGRLLANQGAEVRTTTRSLADEEPFTASETDAAPPGPDLVLDLTSKQVENDPHPLSWAFTAITFTLAPGVLEQTFATELVIRDGEGFVLTEDRLEGRIVQYFGVGTWAGNKLLDWALRDEDDKLTGPVFAEDLSSDLYEQLSQRVFDASLRHRVRSGAVGRAP